MTEQSRIADRLRSFGVGPNPGMRAAGERLLADFHGFQSVDGRAEATTLPDQIVDFVAAAWAFHWFELEHTRAEFARILRPPGWVALVWNERVAKTWSCVTGPNALV